MRDEMLTLGLPAPEFYVSDADTTVTLHSRALEREAAFQSESGVAATEFANLFALSPVSADGVTLSYLNDHRTEFVAVLSDALLANGWYVDRVSYGRLIAHRQGRAFSIPDNVSAIVRFYPAFTLQLRQYWNKMYLGVDYSVEVKSALPVQELLNDLELVTLIGKSAVAFWGGAWHRGRIEAIDELSVRIVFHDYELDAQVRLDKVIPSLSLNQIQQVLKRRAVSFDIHKTIKQFGLSSESNAARTRFERTQAVVADLSQTIFPLAFAGNSLELSPEPASLVRQGGGDRGLRVYTLPEPNVEFGRRRESADIRLGMTTFGSYDGVAREIENCTGLYQVSAGTHGCAD